MNGSISATIAWDFPTLSDPAADAARATDAFRDGADAFSPDIEEAPESTYLTDRRVAYYLSLSLVRKDARSRPVVATVPRPTSLGLSGYPYATEATFVDAFAPMVYWSCTEPGAAVAVEALRPLRPVVPISQDYDMASEGGPADMPMQKSGASSTSRGATGPSA